MNASTRTSFVVTQGRLIRDLTDSYNRLPVGVLPPCLWNVWFPKMPETKIRKVLKKFMWIARLVNHEEISQIFVAGIDPLMLDRVIGSGKPVSGQFSNEHVFLVNEQGEVVTATRNLVTEHKKYFFFGSVRLKTSTVTTVGEVREGSTIRSVIDKLGPMADTIKFILSFDTWTKVAIVYKKPKGADLQGWLNDELEESEDLETENG
jgi:hypothetical protein